jgi:hypothetical protein
MRDGSNIRNKLYFYTQTADRADGGLSSHTRPLYIHVHLLQTAVSVVVCAANGVDFLAPLKPKEPAEHHEMVLPMLSVTVTMVLLKVA